MQVVVDANQASQLPSARSVTREHSISLSPSVLAEILLRTNPIPTLKILQAYYIRLGLKTVDVMQRLIGFYAVSADTWVKSFSPSC